MTKLYENEPDAAKKTAPLLVVDDDDDSRETLRRQLERHGFEVQEAYDGSSALEAIQRQRPSAIVLDLAMRGVSGAELIRLLMTVKSLAKIPVVVVSGSIASLEELRSVTGAKIVATLKKPYALDELLATIREHVA